MLTVSLVDIRPLLTARPVERHRSTSVTFDDLHPSYRDAFHRVRKHSIRRLIR